MVAFFLKQLQTNVHIIYPQIIHQGMSGVQGCQICALYNTLGLCWYMMEGTKFKNSPTRKVKINLITSCKYRLSAEMDILQDNGRNWVDNICDAESSHSSGVMFCVIECFNVSWRLFLFLLTCTYKTNRILHLFQKKNQVMFAFFCSGGLRMLVTSPLITSDIQDNDNKLLNLDCTGPLKLYSKSSFHLQQWSSRLYHITQINSLCI